MRGRRTVGIKDALRAYLKRKGLVTPLDRASAVEEWAEIVGPQIARVTTAEGVSDDGVLYVRVASAAWMQELQMMSPDILRKLGLRGKKIRVIRWKTG